MLENQDLEIDLTVTAAGVRIISLRGVLTLGTLFEFQQAARNEMTRPVIVDLTGVPYMDSAGLGALISVYASCQRMEIGFAIVGVAERVRTLMQVTRVENLLPSFPTLSEAEGFVSRT